MDSHSVAICFSLFRVICEYENGSENKNISRTKWSQVKKISISCHKNETIVFGFYLKNTFRKPLSHKHGS